MTIANNLFQDIQPKTTEEAVESLIANRCVRIERIVSSGHVSPDGFWYDQNETEWVILLKGAARLLIEGDSQPISMNPGDFIHIPAHRRHRVEWTAPDEPTVWLAVFFHDA